jgi:error-prone DNA polymerase
VRFRPIDVMRSGFDCSLEEDAVRLGLCYVHGLRAQAARRIVAERARAPFLSLQEFVDRAELRRDEQRALAEAGALNAFGLTRRGALWQVEKAGRPRGPLFREDEPEPEASPVPEMDLGQRLASDLLLTSVTTGRHPLHLFREAFAARGVRRASDLPALGDGARVLVAGAVICRQRPGTAAGFLFLTLEDETGLVNVIVRPDLFRSEREVLVSEPVLEVEGVLQARDGLSVRAYAVRAAVLGLPALPARHFR